MQQKNRPSFLLTAPSGAVLRSRTIHLRKAFNVETDAENGGTQMRHQLALIVIAAALLSKSAAAQTRPSPSTTPANPTFTPPKTAWGDPDLQGIYTSDDYIGLGLQRNPQYGTRLYFTEEEIKQRDAQIATQAAADLVEESVGGRVGTGPPGHWGERARRSPTQTSLIVEPEDGRLPPLTSEAQLLPVPIGANEGDPQADSWEAFTYYIRCISRGLAGSILPVIYGNGTEIVQSPGYVILMQEMVHEARVIPVDNSPHVGANIRSYMGDSRGHWEGNTLVVDTTNFLGRKTGLIGNGGGTPFSEDLHIVERFTRVDAETINYELDINDPKTYTKPIRILFPIRKEPGYQNFEYACHEGNYGMLNQLSAARAVEKAAAESAKAKN
jgi:hypothetical protein